MTWKPLARARLRAHALGLAVLAAGCSATSDPATGDLRRDLRHRDPRVRMEAAFRAAEGGRKDLEADLVESLGDRDESVRFISGIALKRLTGQDFGFLSYGDAAAREKAVDLWRRWLRGAQEPPAWDDPDDIPPGPAGFSSPGNEGDPCEDPAEARP